MTARSTGAVSDTITNVSPAESLGLMALSAARRKIRSYRGSFHEKTERQALDRPLFPPKKSCIDFSFRKALREPRRILTRYHHVDVR